jgi:glycosyltransferase involved in cell wall biosynthesis
MKILLLDQFNQPGGAQQCLLDLLPGLMEKGWEPLVMLPGEGPLGQAIQRLGIEVLPVSCGPYQSGRKTSGDALRFLSDLPTASAQIADACRRHRASLIYVNGPRLVPAVVAVHGRTPILFHCHSYLSPRYLEWTTAIPLRWARAEVIASSNFVSRPLRRWIHEKRMTVVYNGVPSASEMRQGRTGPVTIGVIGRIAHEKGQDIFLRAAPLIVRQVPECRFIVCGAPLFSDPDFAHQLHSLAEGLPVEFTGWREDVGPILAKLDLLVAPSTPIDATPRVILQAFAAKVPVIAFSNEGFRELLQDGRTGALVPERTPESLAARACDLLQAPPQNLREIADAAYSEWQARFTLEAYRAGILAILERLV